MKKSVQQLDRWRRAIAPSLIRHPSAPHQVYAILRSLILCGVTLALCRHRGILPASHLQGCLDPSLRYAEFLDRVRSLNEQWHQLLPLHPLASDLALRDADLQALLDLCWTPPDGARWSISDLGQIYEQMLDDPRDAALLHLAGRHPEGHPPSPPRRKSTGTYYTPRAIATVMVETAINQWRSHPGRSVLDAPLRILDPACGGGIFLVTAYQYLLQSGDSCRDPDGARGGAQGHLLQQAERLTHHIFGVDLDPDALGVTRTGLLLQFLDHCPGADPGSLPDLSRNLHCGNAIADAAATSADKGAIPHGVPWQDVFPEALDQGGFDVVIGNPPYLDSEWMTKVVPHWRPYCTQQFQTARGNWDLFCVFIEQALRLCKPGGIHSFIVPNKLASADYAAPTRSLLTLDNQLLVLRDYSQVPVFAASVYPLVYWVRRGQSRSDVSVRYELMKDVNRVQHLCHLDYGNHFTTPKQPWLLRINSQQSKVFHHLRANFPPLGQLAQVSGSATVSEAYALQHLMRDAELPGSQDLKVVNSGTIDRYCTLWGQKPMRYLGQQYWHPVVSHASVEQLSSKRYQQAIQPKIMVAGMTRQLECAVDQTGSLLAAKSTSLILTDERLLPLLYLLGILNSQLIHVYFTQTFGGNGLSGGYLRIGPPQLQHIPLRIPDWTDPGDRHRCETLIHHVHTRLELQDRAIAERSDEGLQAVRAGSRTHLPAAIALDQQIDEIVYELYRLTDAEVQTIAHRGLHH